MHNLLSESQLTEQHPAQKIKLNDTEKKLLHDTKELVVSLQSVPKYVHETEAAVVKTKTLQDTESYAQKFASLKTDIRTHLRVYGQLEDEISKYQYLKEQYGVSISEAIRKLAALLEELKVNHELRESAEAYELTEEFSPAIMKLAKSGLVGADDVRHEGTDAVKAVRVNIETSRSIPIGSSLNTGLQIAESGLANVQGYFLNNPVTGFKFQPENNGTPAFIEHDGIRTVPTQSEPFSFSKDGYYLLSMGSVAIGLQKNGSTVTFASKGLVSKGLLSI